MKQDAARIIKERVSVPKATRYYYRNPNRNGFIVCPFHSEKTPSLIIHEHYWHCFGCGAGGSVIDLVMGLFNLEIKDAMRKLADDFNVEIDIGYQTAAERAKAKEQHDVMERHKAWARSMVGKIQDEYFIWELLFRKKHGDTRRPGATWSNETECLYEATSSFYSDSIAHYKRLGGIYGN